MESSPDNTNESHTAQDEQQKKTESEEQKPLEDKAESVNDSTDPDSKEESTEDSTKPSVYSPLLPHLFLQADNTSKNESEALISDTESVGDSEEQKV